MGFNGIGGLGGGNPARANSSATTGFIWKPGGGGVGPVAFDSFSGVMTAIVNARASAGGEVVIPLIIDDTVVSPAQIPSGTWDFDGVRLGGIERAGGFGITEVEILEGAVFINGPFFFDRIRIENKATSTSPITPNHEDVFNVERSVDISNSGAAPMFDCTALTAGQYISFVLSGGALGGASSANPLVDLGANALALLSLYGEGTCNKDVFKTTGSGVRVYQDLRPGGLFSREQSNLTGDYLHDWVTVPPRIKVDTVVYTAAASIDDRDGLKLGDASGGAFAFTLPTMPGSSFDNVGWVVTIKETSGTAGLTVDPGGANTIDGVAGAFAIPAGAAVRFIPDGVSNWTTA